MFPPCPSRERLRWGGRGWGVGGGGGGKEGNSTQGGKKSPVTKMGHALKQRGGKLCELRPPG